MPLQAETVGSCLTPYAKLTCTAAILAVLLYRQRLPLPLNCSTFHSFVSCKATQVDLIYDGEAVGRFAEALMCVNQLRRRAYELVALTKPAAVA